MNPSYRKALKLEPDQFGITLNIAEMGILREIKTLMAPNAADVRAELYKLNM